MRLADSKETFEKKKNLSSNIPAPFHIERPRYIRRFENSSKIIEHFDRANMISRISFALFVLAAAFVCCQAAAAGSADQSAIKVSDRKISSTN
jgi:hypothetical protein